MKVLSIETATERGSVAVLHDGELLARRVEGAANHSEAILRDAETHHPDEPTIQFNLGCYACQRGDLTEARRRVERAIALDGDFRRQAREDADLAPLRATGYAPGELS